MSELVSYEITRTQKAVRVAMDATMRTVGITTPQYGLLDAIQACPGASAAELARQSFHTPQTINEVIGHLELAGLVERRSHPTHGRIRQVRLTRGGEQVLAKAQTAARHIDAHLTSDLTRSEREHLLDLLRRCAAAAE